MLEVENLSKAYNGKFVLKDFSFSLKEKEYISIIGPSGCGKTTLLNIISRIDNNFNGAINWGFNKKELSYFFQDTILLPWLNLYDNITLPLVIEKIKPDSKYIFGLLSDMGLKSCAFFYPDQLSGGMKRRAALACAIIKKPRILILDEPLTGLDFKTRNEMIKLILKLHIKNNMTVIMSTHQIEDAIMMSDKILLLSDDNDKKADVLTILEPRENITKEDISQYMDYINNYYNMNC